jgi:hypothetical protein
MPVKVKEIDGVHRIVEQSGKIVRTKNGTPRDGGGHDNPADAYAQASYINEGSRDRKRRRKKK